MADMNQFHSLAEDPNDPRRGQFPLQPSPYQQNASPYQQNAAPSPYGGPPVASPSYMNHGQPPQQPSPFGPPQGQGSPYMVSPGSDQMAGLTQGMAGMGMGMGTPQPGPTTRRKKDRHAYHQLDQAPDSGNLPPFSPNVTQQMPNQFLGAHSPQPGGGGQFPLPGAPQFVPQSPADPASFHARQPQSQSSAHDIHGAGGQGVDPMGIPSIPGAREASTAHYQTTVFPTMGQVLPPNAASDFVAVDQGNATPRYCRLTLNHVPANQELLSASSLPLALELQPLAKPKSEEDQIPVLDFGEAGPPRCRRCRTYINPFMQFVQGGAKFKCNMCQFPNNEVPNEYYAPVDMAGVRRDREQRPELMRGTVEFMVPKEYWAKKEGVELLEGKGGAPMRFLFLLDVSEGAVNKGTVEATVGGIREALYGESAFVDAAEGEESEDGMEGKKRRLPKGCRVGICTFDKEIHFYNLNSVLDAPQMMVMPDIEEPFLPFQDGLFVDPYESRSVIEACLSTLPTLFSYHKNPEPVLIPALKAALSALEKTGGKIICSLATIPTWGPDRLVFREDSKLYNTEKERTLFKTDLQPWRTLAGKLVEAGVGIDFFLTPTAYIDVATIGHVASTTGGEIFFYPSFVAQRDVLRMRKEIAHVVHRETGYQALLKVRCSNGLQVNSYQGNFLQAGSLAADVEFGTIDEDKALAIMFSYDGKLDPKADAHFQSALLYTTKTGERRVRCSNIVAAVSEQPRDIARWVDQDAVVGVLAREAVSRVLEKPLKEIRGALTEKCVEILAAYRKHAITGSPPGQLILPDGLKEFAMYVLALLKTRAFRGGSVSSDLRTHSMRLLKSMSPLETQLYLYPRIIGIHNLQPGDGFANEAGFLSIPRSTRASFGFIEEGGAYLIDNGQYLLLWIHAHVSPNLLQDLFGEEHSQLASIDAMINELPELETHLNVQVRNLIQWIEGQRGGRKVGLQLARQGIDGAEYEFAAALVEDRSGDEKSYVDWLVHLHKLIQLEMSGERKRDEGIGAGLDPVGGMAGLRPPYW